MNRTLHGAALAALSLFGILNAAQGNFYTDDNRELFLMPRSAAMAGADAALEASALPLGNPSNLAAVPMNSVALSYAQYYQNSFSTSSLSYLGDINDHSGVGVSVSYLLIPGIEMHPDSEYQSNVPVRSASDIFFRVGYGYAWRLGKVVTLDAGAALNGERRGLLDYTGYGIGTDGGVNFRFNLKSISSNAATGLILENLTSSYMRFSSDYAELAYPHVRLNLGWEQDIPYIYGKYSLNYLSPDLLSNEGVNSTQSGSDSGVGSLPIIKNVLHNPIVMLLSGRGGAEYTLMNVVSFRAGLNAGTWSFGGGLHLLHNRANIDLAYLSHADLAPTYKLSLKYSWQ